MFDIADWLKGQDSYEEQGRSLGEKLILVKHKQTGDWRKLKFGLDDADRYLINQEALWLKRSSNCHDIKCYLSQNNGAFHLIIMDYVLGSSMSEHLKSENCLFDHTLMMSSLFEKIEGLHEQGIVHGDIKPSNVVIHEQEANLIDMGSCGWINQAYASKKYRSFTPVYALPNRYLLDSFQPIVDWYAYILMLNLLKKGSVYPLNDVNFDAFLGFQEQIIYSYSLNKKQELFLLKQLKSMA